jgi:hypothetical protein
MIQSAYRQLPEAGYPGSLATSWDVEKAFRPTLINAPIAAKQTIGTLTVTKGANAGDFTIQVIGTAPIGGAYNITVTYSALAGDTATIVGAGLAAAVNANQTLNDFLSASNASGVVTLTVIQPNSNPVTSVTGAATGASNALTTSPTVTNYAANSVVYYGYAMGQYGTAQFNQTALTGGSGSPITTATNLTIAGIAIESKSGEFGYPYSAVAIGGYAPNEAVPLATVGSKIQIWVPVAAAVVAGTVPGVVNTTGQLTTSGSGTALTGALYLTSQSTVGATALVQL